MAAGSSELGTIEAVDRDLLTGLATLVEDVTADFEQYDYARALKITEEFFWGFCDDYLELVKDRAYHEGPAAVSAQTTLRTAVSVLLWLFAQFLPYACEEAWSWGRGSGEGGPVSGFTSGSVHRSSWPDPMRLRARAGVSDGPVADFVSNTELSGPLAPSVLQVAAEVLRQIRKAKSDARRSVRAEVRRVRVMDTGPRLAAVQAVLEDLRSAGNVAELVTIEVADDTEANVEVELLESHSNTI